MDKRERCADCGELGEQTGHMTCQYPQNHADDRGPEAIEFTETAEGYEARHRWARRYDELNGAPEGDTDR